MIKNYGVAYGADFPNPEDVLQTLLDCEIAYIKDKATEYEYILTHPLKCWTRIDMMAETYRCLQNEVRGTTTESKIKDGIYIQLFAVKNGVRYDMKVVDMKEASIILTNSLMDVIEKLYSQSRFKE